MLLSHKFKKPGWILLIASLAVGIILMIGGFENLQFQANVPALYSDFSLDNETSFGWAEVSVTNTLVGVLFIIGCLLVGFSKEKVEDEYIRSIRLSSLQWAVLVNYLLLILAFLFVYGLPFFQVMVYNMFTVLILFVVRFNFLLYRNSKGLSNED